MDLVCPACRRHTERGLELYTVDRDGDLLRCRGCAREYPVLDGIPVLLRDLAQTDALGFFAPLGEPEALAQQIWDNFDKNIYRGLRTRPIINFPGQRSAILDPIFFTESLTVDLSRISGAFVIARSSAFAYKAKRVDLKQIGRDLNVRLTCPVSQTSSSFAARGFTATSSTLP